eukprot:378195-Prymnesium_polylepis.1
MVVFVRPAVGVSSRWPRSGNAERRCPGYDSPPRTCPGSTVGAQVPISVITQSRAAPSEEDPRVYQTTMKRHGMERCTFDWANNVATLIVML